MVFPQQPASPLIISDNRKPIFFPTDFRIKCAPDRSSKLICPQSVFFPWLRPSNNIFQSTGCFKLFELLPLDICFSTDLSTSTSQSMASLCSHTSMFLPWPLILQLRVFQLCPCLPPLLCKNIHLKHFNIHNYSFVNKMEPTDHVIQLLFAPFAGHFLLITGSILVPLTFFVVQKQITLFSVLVIVDKMSSNM